MSNAPNIPYKHRTTLIHTRLGSRHHHLAAKFIKTNANASCSLIATVAMSERKIYGYQEKVREKRSVVGVIVEKREKSTRGLGSLKPSPSSCPSYRSGDAYGACPLWRPS
jgi:hypothetical protein